ncbi:MAG: hypothetical protein A3E83_00105 [Gammaproteobacteria bacterium RIFCSPHIGHO2_12_FULL_41_20]|nr:MAG: hypothetical protein A3E83_00105 [Gammaproteobacteria bacterium RIFCSPHIGHO2_12_FULL_41_20]
MKIYLVGGAVRDQLLGLPIKERDWVVVGATPAELIKQGFRQVGKEFPVFLHPKTNEEYALARMERKTGPGYKGFTFDTSPHVTLEEDLQRRDLTINAMAKTTEGELIDPYHGKADLQQHWLRHVSPAFAEDPVRILRIARFAARFAALGFRIAPETIALMKTMVIAGEVNALVAERVWKELERALGERNPEEFFHALDQCHALTILFPHLTMDSLGIVTLKHTVSITTDPTIRFATLLHAQPDPKTTISQLCNRYRVPVEFRELALLTALHYRCALIYPTLTPEELLQLFLHVDAFRREQRCKKFLFACEAIAQAQSRAFNSSDFLHLYMAAKSVNTQVILAQGLTGNAFAEELHRQRVAAIKDKML